MQSPSWLRIDVAVASILGIALPDGQEQAAGDETIVYHMLNPRNFHWTHGFVPALKRTGLLPPFDNVPLAQWLAKMTGSEPDIERNPSRKLLGFWEAKYGEQAAGKKGLEHETVRILETAPRLGKVIMVDILRNDNWLQRVVGRCVGSW